MNETHSQPLSATYVGQLHRVVHHKPLHLRLMRFNPTSPELSSNQLTDPIYIQHPRIATVGPSMPGDDMGLI